MLPSGAGYCSTEQQYSGGGGVVTLQCMIAAERLLAATLVYMMLILAGDIETNPGPTLCEYHTFTNFRSVNISVQIHC